MFNVINNHNFLSSSAVLWCIYIAFSNMNLDITCNINLSIFMGLPQTFNNIISTNFPREVRKIIMIDQILLFLNNVRSKIFIWKIVSICCIFFICFFLLFIWCRLIEKKGFLFHFHFGCACAASFTVQIFFASPCCCIYIPATFFF